MTEAFETKVVMVAKTFEFRTIISKEKNNLTRDQIRGK